MRFALLVLAAGAAYGSPFPVDSGNSLVIQFRTWNYLLDAAQFGASDPYQIRFAFIGLRPPGDVVQDVGSSASHWAGYEFAAYLERAQEAGLSCRQIRVAEPFEGALTVSL